MIPVTKRSLLVALACAAASAVLVLDCLLPLGVVVPVAYIVAVFLMFLTSRVAWVWMATLACTGLTFTGWYLSSTDGIRWDAVENRCLSLFAIWTTALFCLKVLGLRERREHLQDQLQDTLRKHQMELENLVQSRSADLYIVRGNLELALTGANVGLWDWNAKTNQVYFSPTYMTQLGYPADHVWNQFDDWQSGLHPDDREAALDRVQQYFAHQTNQYRSTFRLRCMDGSYRWILAQGKAEFDDSGQPTRMVGVHVDITDQISAEHELKRLNDALGKVNEALQESNVELQQFAYVASHDLQTPLRAISGFAQLLQTDYANDMDSRGNDYINRIVGGVKRMQRMINDLLAYSRVESRAAPFEPVDLNAVFDEAICILEASITDTGAVVTRDQLPTVMGDASQLTQLLSNLISNAIKYHLDQPNVHVSAIQSASGWTVAVRDQGIGIAADDHERIFEVFRRLHTRDQYPGTGIGLAVCRRIAKRHRAKITVESEPGIGSTFSLHFPGPMKMPDGSPVPEKT